MAIIQEIKDGKFVDGTSDSSSKKKNERTVNNDMGKDQFLQLLVAQMQYQDPLEPAISATPGIMRSNNAETTPITRPSKIQYTNPNTPAVFGTNIIIKDIIIRGIAEIASITRSVVSAPSFPVSIK